MTGDTDGFGTVLSGAAIAVVLAVTYGYALNDQYVFVSVLLLALVLHLPVLHHYAVDASGTKPRAYETASWVLILSVVSWTHLVTGESYLLGGFATGLGLLELIAFWRAATGEVAGARGSP